MLSLYWHICCNQSHRCRDRCCYAISNRYDTQISTYHVPDLTSETSKLQNRNSEVLPQSASGQKVPYDHTFGERCFPGPRVLLPQLGSSHVFATRWRSVAASDLRLLFQTVRFSHLSFHGMLWNICCGRSIPDISTISLTTKQIFSYHPDPQPSRQPIQIPRWTHKSVGASETLLSRPAHWGA